MKKNVLVFTLIAFCVWLFLRGHNSQTETARIEPAVTAVKKRQPTAITFSPPQIQPPKIDKEPNSRQGEVISKRDSCRLHLSDYQSYYNLDHIYGSKDYEDREIPNRQTVLLESKFGEQYISCQNYYISKGELAIQRQGAMANNIRDVTFIYEGSLAIYFRCESGVLKPVKLDDGSEYQIPINILKVEQACPRQAICFDDDIEYYEGEKHSDTIYDKKTYKPVSNGYCRDIKAETLYSITEAIEVECTLDPMADMTKKYPGKLFKSPKFPSTSIITVGPPRKDWMNLPICDDLRLDAQHVTSGYDR